MSSMLGYGYDFPPVKERMDRLEEALAIAKAMFTEDRPTVDGTYYRIEGALNVPRPSSQAVRPSSSVAAASSRAADRRLATRT